MKRFVAVAALPLTLAAFVGCDEHNDDRGIGDAPVDQQPDEERKVWPNGNLFPNVSGFCIGGNGVYSTTSNSAPVVVVVDDPECGEGGVLGEE